MGKRMTEINKWKGERWFRLLPPNYKLAWEYLHAVCDQDGMWLINVLDLIDDLRFEGFDLPDFIAKCNTDYHNITGEVIKTERVLRVGLEYLWLTGYMTLQLEEKKFKQINPDGGFAEVAIYKLGAKGVLWEALLRGYFQFNFPIETLPMGAVEGSRRGRDIEIDRGRDREILEYIYNSDNREKRRGTGRKGGGRQLTVVHSSPITSGGGEPTAGESQLPLMDAAMFEEFSQRLQDDHSFIDPLMMSMSLNPTTLKPWIEFFNAHIVAEKKVQKDYDEYRKHFKNWIKKQDTTAPPVKAKVNGNHVKTGERTGNTIQPVTAEDLKKYK